MIPFASLLIFASIGFATLFILPNTIVASRVLSRELNSALLTFYGFLMLPSFICSIFYLIGVCLVLLYFCIEDFLVGMSSYWVITISTVAFLFSVLIAISVAKGAIGKMIEMMTKSFLHGHAQEL